MKLFTNSFSLSKILVLTGILVVSLTVNYLQAAWTAPTAPPTGGNIAAPVNTSNAGQNKPGYLGLNQLFSLTDIEVRTDAAPDIKNLTADFNGSVGATEYCDATGASCFTASSVGTGGSALPSCSDGDVLKYQSGSWVCGTDEVGSAAGLPNEIVYVDPHELKLTGVSSDVLDMSTYASNVRRVYLKGVTFGGTTDTNGYERGYRVEARPYNVTSVPWTTVSSQLGSGSNTGFAWVDTVSNLADVRIVNIGSGGASVFGTPTASVAGYECNGACN